MGVSMVARKLFIVPVSDDALPLVLAILQREAWNFDQDGLPPRLLGDTRTLKIAEVAAGKSRILSVSFQLQEGELLEKYTPAIAAWLHYAWGLVGNILDETMILNSRIEWANEDDWLGAFVSQYVESVREIEPLAKVSDRDFDAAAKVMQANVRSSSPSGRLGRRLRRLF